MRFSKEQKQQLVARYQNGESVANICLETGIPRSTFYSWIKLFQTQITKSGMVVSPQEFLLLKRHVNKLEETVAVLKAADCTASAPLQTKLKELEKLYGRYSIHTLCDALDVPRGTFYNHVRRNKRDKAWYVKHREDVSQKIRDIYEENHQIFGAGKIHALLTEQGVVTSKKYVIELMREMGLISMSPSAKKEYKHLYEFKQKKNILNRNFTADRPNQIWISDITCFKLKGKHYYISMIMDLYSRKIIAYRISPNSSTKIVSYAFRQAYESRNQPKGLIFHSDQGAQYTSIAFRNLLLSYGVEQSFSNTGRPHDNAVAEAFFASLKREGLYRRDYSSVAEFEKGVAAYIKFYNSKRPHGSLGYKTPEQMEEAIKQMRS